MNRKTLSLTIFLVIMKLQQIPANEPYTDRQQPRYHSPCCNDGKEWGHVIFYGSSPNTDRRRYQQYPAENPSHSRRWERNDYPVNSKPPALQRPESNSRFKYEARQREPPPNRPNEYIPPYSNSYGPESNRRMAFIFPYKQSDDKNNHQDRQYRNYHESPDSFPSRHYLSSPERKREEDYRKWESPNQQFNFPEDKYFGQNKFSQNSSYRERYRPALLASYNKKDSVHRPSTALSPPEIEHIIHRVPKNFIRFPDDENLHRFSIQVDKPTKVKIHRHFYKGVPVYVGKEDGSSEDKEYDPRFIEIYRIVLESYHKKEDKETNMSTTSTTTEQIMKTFHPSEPLNHFSEPDPLYHPNGSALITFPIQEKPSTPITTTTTTAASTSKEPVNFPDSINAQLPPPEPGEDTRVPYVSASTIGPQASAVKLEDTDSANSQKRIATVSQNSSVKKPQGLSENTYQNITNTPDNKSEGGNQTNSAQKNIQGSYIKSAITVEIDEKPKHNMDKRNSSSLQPGRNEKSAFGVNTTVDIAKGSNFTKEKLQNNSENKTDSSKVTKNITRVVVVTSYARDPPLTLFETSSNGNLSKQGNITSNTIALHKRTPGKTENHNTTESSPQATVTTSTARNTTSEKSNHNETTEEDTYSLHHEHGAEKQEMDVPNVTPLINTKPEARTVDDHLMDVVHYATYHVHLHDHDHSHEYIE